MNDLNHISDIKFVVIREAFSRAENYNAETYKYGYIYIYIESTNQRKANIAIAGY